MNYFGGNWNGNYNTIINSCELSEGWKKDEIKSFSR